jgi:sentrin-specific protease 1
MLARPAANRIVSNTHYTRALQRKVPQQNNSSDCGVFLCTFAEHAARGAPFAFTQNDMPYFRRRITYEILKCSLLQ